MIFFDPEGYSKKPSYINEGKNRYKILAPGTSTPKIPKNLNLSGLPTKVPDGSRVILSKFKDGVYNKNFVLEKDRVRNSGEDPRGGLF